MADLDALVEAVEAAESSDTVDGVAHDIAARVRDVDDAYLVCLGRQIDDAAVTHGVREEPLPKVINDMLHSVEFRERLVHRILFRHEEVRRGFYIHVPKTAGTSVKAALDSRADWALLDAARVADRSEFPLPQLLVLLVETYNRLQAGDTQMLWLAGHTALAQYTDAGVVRSSDVIFGTIRHPLELYVSEANYVVRKILEDPLQPTSLIRSQWLVEAELPPDSDATAAARALLFASEGFRLEMQNLMTRYFGRGEHEASGLEAYAAACHWKCALLTTDQVPSYLQRLGVSVPLGRLNKSADGQLTWRDLSHGERLDLVKRFAMHDLILWQLAQFDTLAAD